MKSCSVQFCVDSELVVAKLAAIMDHLVQVLQIGTTEQIANELVSFFTKVWINVFAIVFVLTISFQ